MDMPFRMIVHPPPLSPSRAHFISSPLSSAVVLRGRTGTVAQAVLRLRTLPQGVHRADEHPQQIVGGGQRRVHPQNVHGVHGRGGDDEAGRGGWQRGGARVRCHPVSPKNGAKPEFSKVMRPECFKNRNGGNGSCPTRCS